jgi:hypothetical protein
MKRDPMGLTLPDLEKLSVLVRDHPRSHSAAAKAVGLNRAHLARLIDRVNKLIGEDLEWRVDGDFQVPSEVRRLVSRYIPFATELAVLGHAPRVSAGTCATFMLAAVLSTITPRLPRCDVVRSRDVLPALESCEIDMAFVHGRSIGLHGDASRYEIKREIVGLPVLTWRAVIVRRVLGSAMQEARVAHASWQAGSTGELINLGYHLLPPPKPDMSFGIPCQSFLHAIELVRRGLVEEVVVPDIYLPPYEPSLVITVPEKTAVDQLVAVCRTHELPRWAALADPAAWDAIASRNRAKWGLGE